MRWKWFEIFQIKNCSHTHKQSHTQAARSTCHTAKSIMWGWGNMIIQFGMCWRQHRRGISRHRVEGNHGAEDLNKVKEIQGDVCGKIKSLTSCVKRLGACNESQFISSAQRSRNRFPSDKRLFINSYFNSREQIAQGVCVWVSLDHENLRAQ